MTRQDVFRLTVEMIPLKYLPGGIWHMASRVLHLRSKGVENRLLALTTLFEVLLPALVSTVVAIGLFFLNLVFAPKIGYVEVIIIYTAIFFTAILMFNYGATGKRNVLVSIVLHWVNVAMLFGCWFSIFNTPGLILIENMVNYLLSWAVGNLAFFAPQGVAVTEGVFLLLDTSTSLSTMMVALVGFRMLLMIGDVSILFCWLLIRKWLS
ncbi:hypothetical protein BGP77_12530 [Saccharospirillum sp. MSK14-1]|nr:hypothetical protein BGP77_12530 [Saccharospirillum sp. MSK14-1]